METKELNGNGKIIIKEKEIYVPHLDEVLVFNLPMEGPNYFEAVMSKIDADKGLRPTTGQTLSLIDLALQNPDEEHYKDILSKFRNNYFWTSTESLYTPKEVIVYDNIDGTMPSDRKSLIKNYEDGDKRVRIVSYGFETGSQSVDELLRNPYITAQIGNKNLLDVVKRVAEGVSKMEPFVWALNRPTENIERYTMLCSKWGGDRFVLIGDYSDGNCDGFASRVRVRNASAEGAKPRKN